MPTRNPRLPHDPTGTANLRAARFARAPVTWPTPTGRKSFHRSILPVHVASRRLAGGRPDDASRFSRPARPGRSPASARTGHVAARPPAPACRPPETPARLRLGGARPATADAARSRTLAARPDAAWPPKRPKRRHHHVVAPRRLPAGAPGSALLRRSRPRPHPTRPLLSSSDTSTTTVGGTWNGTLLPQHDRRTWPPRSPGTLFQELTRNAPPSGGETPGRVRGLGLPCPREGDQAMGNAVRQAPVRRGDVDSGRRAGGPPPSRADTAAPRRGPGYALRWPLRAETLTWQSPREYRALLRWKHPTSATDSSVEQSPEVADASLGGPRRHPSREAP